MLVSTDIINEAGPEVPCQCGRTRLHCPLCGRASFYWVKALDIVKKTPEGEAFVKGYRCAKCGAQFREDSVCTAQPAARQKSVAAVQQQLSGVADEVRSSNSKSGIESRKAILQMLRLTGKTDQAAAKEQEWRGKGLKYE